MKTIQPVELKELLKLSRKYGVPRRVMSALPAWPMPRIARGDRRGEVVFAIANRKQKILLHTKSFYPDGVFRLPGGGIRWDEKVEDALYREVEEETGLTAQIDRFVAVIEYEVRRKRQSFATYLFLLNSDGKKAKAQDLNEDIAAFKTVTRAELAAVGQQLRHLPEEWRVWGAFRAIAHDLIVDALAQDSG